MKSRGIDLAIVQIRNICRRGELACFADSSPHFINCTQHGDGRLYSLEEDIGSFSM
jgi:hypothetical protein